MYSCLRKIDDNNNKPIREVVLEELRRAIFNNMLKPGDRLVEISIAEAMGVSRTPVREALRQLELEDLAVNTPRKGTIVQGISYDRAMEMYEIREVLEGLATKLACLNISRIKINELKELLENMEHNIINKDVNKVYYLNQRWNEIILEACNNELLVKKVSDLYEQLRRLTVFSLYDENLQRSAMNEYSFIVEAIEKGDENKAENLAREHVRKAKNRFTVVYKNS
ncbi:GntR family transcriptional regulator [Clostridium hydrogeniformans]|uniref:GntR family transcriptional regulator n=1 Tax=Clostridium hydrogeniformans TaxID=349933 RepID=UPI0004851E71|nr:GntR family transcriptional regulator [Clostridium hydrogeniformans]